MNHIGYTQVLHHPIMLAISTRTLSRARRQHVHYTARVSVISACLYANIVLTAARAQYYPGKLRPPPPKGGGVFSNSAYC